MAVKVVLASKRFQRAYPEFLLKYHSLETNFKEFLAFRAKTRPDESFNQKDSRISGTKFWRCHLIHGKAILIYQLVGSELRLVDLDDHKIVDGGTNYNMRNYAKSLTAEDYYKFDIDAPRKPKPVESNMSQTVQQPDPTPEAQPLETPEPATSANPLLSDKTLDYLRDQQLLYVPRPTQPMIMIRLTKEIIAPKGDVLAIDPVNQTIYVLTANEVAAHFQPAKQNATTISEAIAATLPQHPPQRPEPINESPEENEEDVSGHRTPRQGRRQPVAPQMGRLLLAIAYAEKAKKTSRLDTATIREYMPDPDRKMVSVLMSDAQNKGFVKKAGNKPAGSSGGRYWYTLTPKGQGLSKILGNQPFIGKGIRSVFPLAAE